MENNNLIFLSHVLDEATPSYGNRDYFKIVEASSIAKGDTANTSRWIFSNNHLGTHIDVPYHFDEKGKKISNYKAKEWFFKSPFLINIFCDDALLIGSEHFENKSIPKDVDLLLIRTGFEQLRKDADYIYNSPGLNPKFIPYLKKRLPKLRCIGFDFISVTSWKYRKEGKEAHRKLLADKKRPVMAIEDMRLSGIKNQPEWVIVAPLIVENSNGGPVTVIAQIKEK